MIQVENLTKSYGKTKALKGVTFSINKGEIVGFLGPNGAGKSTTMKILTCYMPADSGQATVAGFDTYDKSLQVRRRIGYLPESAPLYSDMVVVDFLKFAGSMHGLKGNRLAGRVRNVVDRTGLTSAVAKNIGELSKGYRQRVGLAAALIHEPDILILDEPTSGLDPNQIVEIRDLIREIGREKTVILSTHILPEVTATCDRAIIINNGQVVASGTPDELIRRGSGAAGITATVHGPQPDVEHKLASIPGVDMVRQLEIAKDGGVRLHVDSESGQNLPEKIFRCCVENGWVMTELRQDVASLEDVFAELTRQ